MERAHIPSNEVSNGGDSHAQENANGVVAVQGGGHGGFLRRANRRGLVRGPRRFTAQ